MSCEPQINVINVKKMKAVGLDELLIGVYDDIGSLEEKTLKDGHFRDLSVKEMHTIEAIGLHERRTAGEVAARLGITLGTLSVAINGLVRKDYVSRTRNEDDRRRVILALTNKGRLLCRMHRMFHSQLVKEAVSGLSEDEKNALLAALGKLHIFLKDKCV